MSNEKKNTIIHGITSDEQAIIATLTEQAQRSPGWKVQKLIDELRRRIDNHLPIPAGNTTVSADVAEAVIKAIRPYAR